MPSERREYRIVSDGNWFRVQESYRTLFRKRLAWRRVNHGSWLFPLGISHRSRHTAEQELAELKSKHDWTEVRDAD